MKRKSGMVSVSRACFLCKKDHKACNGARPCARCISLEVPERCEDVALKPRGRPRKQKLPTNPDTCTHTNPSSPTTTSTTSTTEARVKNEPKTTGAALVLQRPAIVPPKKRVDMHERSSTPIATTSNTTPTTTTQNARRNTGRFRAEETKERLSPQKTSYKDSYEPKDPEEGLVSSFPFSPSHNTYNNNNNAHNNNNESRRDSWSLPSASSWSSSVPYSTSSMAESQYKATTESSSLDGIVQQQLCHRFKILQHKVQQNGNGPAPTLPLQPQPIRPQPTQHNPYDRNRGFKEGDEEEEVESSGWLQQWKHQKQHSPPHQGFVHNNNNQNNNHNTYNDEGKQSKSAPHSPVSSHQWSSSSLLPSISSFSPLSSSSSFSSVSRSLNRPGGGAFHDFKMEGRKRKDMDEESDEGFGGRTLAALAAYVSDNATTTTTKTTTTTTKKQKRDVKSEEHEEEEEEEEEEIWELTTRRDVSSAMQQDIRACRQPEQKNTSCLWKASLSFVCN